MKILIENATSTRTQTESCQGVEIAVSGHTGTRISRHVQTCAVTAHAATYLATGALGARSLAGGNHCVAAKRPIFANVPSFDGSVWFFNQATAGMDHSQQRERST